jgi:adenylate kinase
MPMDLDIIFFIGPQGSGKGTQARALAERLGFFYWEMGAICREITTEDSDLGRKTKELVDKGVLLSDEHLLEIAKKKLSSLPKNKGIVFDGIPRRIGQAEFLIDYLKNNGRKVFATLYLSLPKEESIARLLRRAEMEGRKDDTIEAIERRLRYYENDTVPVLGFLRAHTSFIEVDGRPPVEEVTKEMEKALGL